MSETLHDTGVWPKSAPMQPDDPGGEPTPPRPWWKHPATIISSLVLFFPVGLVLVWRSDWSSRTKVTATAVTVLLVMIAGLTAPDGSESGAQQADRNVTTTAAPATSAAERSTTSTAPTTTAAPTTAPPPPPTTAAPDPFAGETVSQRNARRSAESYLGFSAFSRTGLIDQLEYEGYSQSDAGYGVDALNVDWNDQAAKSAANYLEFSPFSRSGLIDQLLYEGFTREQAEYGVGTTGL